MYSQVPNSGVGVNSNFSKIYQNYPPPIYGLFKERHPFQFIMAPQFVISTKMPNLPFSIAPPNIRNFRVIVKLSKCVKIIIRARIL